MTNFKRKFVLLLWKNYVVQKRHKIQTCVEILVPVFFSALLVLIRYITNSDKVTTPTHYPGFNPSEFSLPVTLTESRTFIVCCNEVIYTPNISIINTLMEHISNSTVLVPSSASYAGFSLPVSGNSSLNFVGFPSESEMESYQSTRKTVLAGIVFKNMDGNASAFHEEIHYSLRFPAKLRVPARDRRENPTGTWFTELLYPLYQLLGPRGKKDVNGATPYYASEGFLYLQLAIDKALIRSQVENITFPRVMMQRYPYPPYIDDRFLVALQGWLPMILMLSFIYPTINITKSIVHEKEKRLKETMKMMGLPNYLHWLAWFLKSFIFLWISSILMITMIKIRWFENGALGVITYGGTTILLAFILAYILSVISLGFLLSTFFSKANSAATAAGVIFFFTYFPYFFLQPRYHQLSKPAKIFASLLSNTGMAFGCQIIAMFEGTGAGIQWSTIASGSSPDDSMSILNSILMLIFDSILYLIIAWYIEGVWPGEFGTSLPWNFPFTKSYWIRTTENSSSRSTPLPTPSDSLLQPNFEKVEGNGMKKGVQIHNLSKAFKGKIAVRSLTLDMFQNQITALLGHNGAGKTTTMSMLTGLLQPTSGTATMNGFDIREEMAHVRASLGVCPQHDVLFDELTVHEHLEYFCEMKGADPKGSKSEIERMIKALRLELKRDAQSYTLSGGMKRKLCVGIALVGGSKIVLLDEPTSGMDPGARRSTWDLLQAEKSGRTLVLSTHFMDEADALGDRIAIMAHGRVQCCGSSLFLKKQYGGGYHLAMVKETHASVDNITSLLQKTVPDIQIEQNVGGELSYSLPESQSSLFPDMFDELEENKRQLGISSYGAGITTLEEVFIKVGREAEEAEGSVEVDPRVTVNGEVGHQNPAAYQSYALDVKNTGGTLLVQQMRAMFVKKMLYATRNRLLLSFQTIIPILFLTVALIMIQTLPGLADPPLLDINLQKYRIFGNPVTTASCQKNANEGICAEYLKFAANQGSEINKLEGEVFEEYILKEAKKDLVGVNFHHNTAMESNEENITAFFNAQSFHGPPLALNFITNSILRNGSMGLLKTIKISNHPFPWTAADKISQAGSFATVGFQVAFNIAFGMSFLAASFVVFLIKERVTNSKHLQFVSGVKFPIFWGACFLFDVLNYIIPCFGLMLLLVGFRTESFFAVDVQGYVFILFCFYGYAVIPLMYLFNFAFSIPSSGFTRMVLFNLFTGTASILAHVILLIPELELESVGEKLDWFFMLLPQFNLGLGLLNISAISTLKRLCTNEIVRYCKYGILTNMPCCSRFPRDYLDWKADGIGRNILYLFLIGTISFAIVLISESKIIEKIQFWRTRQVANDPVLEGNVEQLEDSDVLMESERIRKTQLTELFKTENLILRDLTKMYGKFLAVDKLCLGVGAGECFGLLGVNGAGKTSTFKMLSGDVPVTSGDAYVLSHSIKSNMNDVQKNLGYCPQYDGIIEELTGREIIRLYARLRGVPEQRIEPLVDTLGTDLLLCEHMDKRCGAYSGGNKRKLSVAIALVGNPPIVFLDEPTTGMDPVARRHLWNTVTKVRDGGTSVILTSHSMDECEVLCTRLCVMVNGKFRCLGSPQHLKTKFGEGYTLVAQISLQETDQPIKRASIEMGRRRSSLRTNVQAWELQLVPLRNYIEESFQGAQLKDLHPGYVEYHVEVGPNVTWGQLFRKMEIAKSRFHLEAYSVGQTTLEQVFLNFSKAQLNSED